MPSQGASATAQSPGVGDLGGVFLGVVQCFQPPKPDISIQKTLRFCPVNLPYPHLFSLTINTPPPPSPVAFFPRLPTASLVVALSLSLSCLRLIGCWRALSL